MIEEFTYPRDPETFYCGNFEYLLETTPESTFIQLEDGILSIFSDDYDDAGTYLVEITGALPTGHFETIQFTLNMVGRVNTAPYFKSALKD